MSQVERTRRGYLLLADISGYTAFLVGTELEHADAIVNELISLIRERLAPPMRFVKVEGDAVFCYADEPVFYCASSSTGARTATSPPGRRRWVARRFSSAASRLSTSPRPTPERWSTTGFDSRIPDR